MARFSAIEVSSLTRGSAAWCPQRGCTSSSSAARCSPGSLVMLWAGEAGRHHLLLLPGQAAVMVNLIFFALLSTGCFHRVFKTSLCRANLGAPSASPSPPMMSSRAVCPQEDAAPQGWDPPAPGLGAALREQAFPNLSPKPGKWCHDAEARKESRATPELLQQHHSLTLSVLATAGQLCEESACSAPSAP